MLVVGALVYSTWMFQLSMFLLHKIHEPIIAVLMLLMIEWQFAEVLFHFKFEGFSAFKLIGGLNYVY